MNADETLTRTFADHEDLAPDAERVLAGIRAQLEGRRRRTTTRALSTLAAAAAIAAVAVGITVVSGHAGPDRAPVQAGGSRTVAPTSSSAPSFSAARSTPPRPATKFVLTIGAGWLPGTTPGGQVGVSTGSTSQSRDYLVKYGQDDLDLELRVDRERSLPGRQKGLAPSPTTLNGQPAVEYAKLGFYQLSFKTGDGQVAGVYLNPHLQPFEVSEYSAAALTRIGRHIARTMRFDAREVVKTSAVLTYLPGDVAVGEVQTWDNGTGGTTYTLHAPGGNDEAQVMIGGTESGVAGDIGKPARSVHGHRTRVAHYPSGYQLVVYGYRPGVSVALSSGTGVTTLAQLYRIADGIRFTG